MDAVARQESACQAGLAAFSRPYLIPSAIPAYNLRMFCGLHIACRTARAAARCSARLLATSIALGLLLRLSRP